MPFDRMPYCTSLCQHNPRIYDLFNSIPVSGHEHELFARSIKNNTEIEGKLFTPKSEIEGFEDIDELIRKYNAALYYKHTGRRLEEYKGHIYIREYAKDSAEIIKKLQQLSSSGVSQYTASVDSWLSRESYSIDDEGKKEALRHMFENSHVAIVYGSAGTGKSTLINHIANFWGEKDKIFLANTHPAVDNMRRKVTAGNSEYNTIAKFLSNKNLNTECDILFIDECSTVSNNDMRQVLEKANFKLLVLVGDVYQIESIYFGNWFSIAQKFVPATSVFELTSPYRTTNPDLLTVWDRVRRVDDAILEPLVKNVVVKLFCNICGLNLLDCCLEAIGTVRFYQWCFAPLRGHAIDKICHFRFFAITQSNQETCFRRPLCCCPHLVWCAVTVIAMWAHMIVGSIGEFLHRVIEFLFRPKFVQIRAFVL